MDEAVHTSEEGGETLAERAAARLQREILSGRIRPGSRLGVANLVASYGIGATPIREGLSRMVSKGLIVAIGRRGFRVSQISSSDLADITRLRVLVECEGMKLSLTHGDDAWEASVLASLHRLRLFVDRHGERFGEGSPEFDALHKGFHASLIEGCGSPRIKELASNLYDQAYRYRRLMMNELTDPEVFISDHEVLANAFLARDRALAENILKAHLNSTLHYIYPETSRNSGKTET